MMIDLSKVTGFYVGKTKYARIYVGDKRVYPYNSNTDRITFLMESNLTLTFNSDPHTADVVEFTDWGDGTVDSLRTHTYAKPGQYTISTTMNMKLADNATKLCCIALESLAKTRLSGYQMFKGCINLREVKAFNNVVNNCDEMFSGCYGLTTVVDLPESLLYANSMFELCTSLKTAPKFNSKLKDCNHMFRSCSKLTTVQNDLPSTVRNAANMFYNTNLIIAPNLNDGIVNCDNMFYGCVNLTTPPSILPGSITNCSYMFGVCTSMKTTPIISEGIKDCTYLFYRSGITNLNGTIPNSVQKTNYMFRECASLIEAAVITNYVTDCTGMFYSCTNLTTLPQENIDLLYKYNSSLISSLCYYGCVRLTNPVYSTIPSNWK